MTDLLNHPRILRLWTSMHDAMEEGHAQPRDVEFGKSLVEQASRRGLSEKQWTWVDKLAERFEAAVKAQPEAPAERTYPRLAETFLAAAKGRKFPKLRLRTAAGQELVLSRCGERSRTPGQIRMTDDRPFGMNEFFGTISPEGAPDFRSAVNDDVRATLAAYNADPEAEAKVQGVRTGRCMCCGIELTDEVSIELGIGPVCGKRWGISRKGVRAKLRETSASPDLFAAA